MSAAQTTYMGTVYPAECDHMGHMNVAHYVAKFDQASWNFFYSLGFTPGVLRDGPFSLAAVEQKVNYKRELYPGDVLEIRTHALEVKPKTIRFLHEMIHRESGALAATSEYVTVCLDKATRKSVPYPEAMSAKARSTIA